MNHTMKIISGKVKSTHTHWSTVLAHIASTPQTYIRRQAVICNYLLKMKEKYNLSAHRDIFNHPAKRLKSRNLVWECLDSELDIERKHKSTTQH